MECTRFLKLISTYIDEEAGVLERQALEKHIASCSSCRAELTRQLTLKDMVKSSFDKTADVDFSKNIMAMIKKEKPAEVKKVSLFKKISVFAAAAAALFVFALAAFMSMGTEDSKVAGNEKLEEYVIEHVGAGVSDFNVRLATVNLEK